jgi:hypothetical protein
MLFFVLVPGSTGCFSRNEVADIFQFLKLVLFLYVGAESTE